MTTGYAFAALAESQRGDAYVFGAEAKWSDPDPARFDCSELVEWCLRRLGVAAPDGSAAQWRWCRDAGRGCLPAQAIRTRGALLFRMSGSPTHVAISRGDGTTIEARGRAYGVNEFSAFGRAWTSGALVPGVDYSGKQGGLDVTQAELDAAIAAIKGSVDATYNALRDQIGAISARLAEIGDTLARIERKA